MMKFISNLIKLKEYPATQAVELVNASPNAKKQFIKLIEEGTCHVYAKAIFNKTVGVIFLFTNLDDKDLADGENTCYIANLFVHPKFRGKGIGTEILEYIFQVAREKGFKQMTLGVDEAIEKNVRLYKKLGFTKEVKKSSLDASVKDKNGNHLTIKEHLVLAKDL